MKAKATAMRAISKRIGGIFLACSLIFSQSLIPALAAGEYDLSSQNRTVASPYAGVIKVGSTVHRVNAGDLITPAELTALNQVVGSGRQNINVATTGAAVGGSFNIVSDLSHNAASLVVPHNVQAFGDFSLLNGFNLAGNLTNFGQFYAYSTSNSVANASINAANIYNQQGALLTSTQPPGILNAIGNLNLDLNAVGDIMNSGIISSAGSLSLTSGSGKITNNGTLAAYAGNINIQAGANSNLIFDSRNGTVEALSGVVNVGNLASSGIINTTITGGDFATQHLNVYSSCGDAQIHPRSLLGDVAITAGSTHVSTDVGDLTVASLVVSGDPELDAPGNLTVFGLQAAGQPITLIAGGNITIKPNNTGPSGFGLDTSSGSGPGGAILIVAGAAFTTGGGNVTITGASATGGAIILDDATFANNSIGFINTGSSPQVAGDVTMIAFPGSDGASGQVSSSNTSTVAIYANGVGTDLTILAPKGITMGAMGIGDPGALVLDQAPILLANSQPVLVGSVVVNQTTGQVVSGSFTAGATGTGGVQLIGNGLFNGGYTAATGAIEIRGGNGGVSTTQALFGVSLTITSLSTIAFTSTQDTVSTGGAIVMVAQDGITTNRTVADTRYGAGALPSGAVVLVAGADFTETAGTINIIGPSAGATSGMNLNTGNLGGSTINSGSDFSGVSGNDTTILSYQGASGTSTVSLGSGSNGKILTGGIGAGTTNGNITIVSAQNSGAAITGGIINPTGGDPGSGNVTLAVEQPGTNLQIAKGTGAITGNVFSGTLQNGSLTPQSITVDDGDLTFHGGALTDVPAYSGTANHLTIKSGANFAPASPITAGSLAIQTTGTVNLSTTTTVDNSIAVTAGDTITVSTDLVAPGGIVLVSGHNITTGAAGLNIDASSSTAAGGNLTAIAGAQFTETDTTVTVTGASPTGGMVDFKTNALANLKTTSTNTDSAGGDVTLVAFAGSDNSGNVSVAGPIATGGNGTGDNGDLLVVAGKTSATSIDLPAIDTTGGASGTGNISLHAATPNTTPTVDVSKATAAVTGDFTGGTVQNAVVSVASITIDHADITVESNGTPVIGPITGTVRTYNVNGTDVNITTPVTVDNLNLHSTNNITIGADINAVHVVLLSEQDVNLNANITAPGGILLVTSRNINSAAGSPISLSTDSSTAGAGNVTLVSGAQFTAIGNTVTITGGTSNGNINLNSSNFAGISAVSTVPGGNGGNINVIALSDGSVVGNGFITFSGSAALSASGGGVGQNGNITLVSARNDGNTAILFPIGSTINSSVGLGGNGNVTLRAGAPTFNIDLSEVTCDVSAGSFTGGSTRNGFIDVNSTITMATGKLLVQSAGQINLLAVVNGGTTSSIDVQTNGTAQLGTLFSGSVSATAGGNINLFGNIDAPAGLVMVSTGNINSIAGNLSISTGSLTSNAGDMTMVAGALFTQTSTAVTITGPVASGGGRINFSNSADLDSSASFSGTSGGTITLVALTSPGTPSEGQVNLGGGTAITTGGSGTGSNGDLIVVASRSDTGTGISMPSGSSIDTTGGAAGTGNVTLRSAVPDFTTQVVIDKPTGAVTAGSFTGGTLAAGFVEKQDGTFLTMNGGTLKAASNSRVDVRGTNNLGAATVDIRAGSSANVGIINAQTISVTANADLAILGSLAAPGGMVLVAGGNIGTVSGGLTLSTASATSDAGDMTLVAGALFTQTDAAVTVTGPVASGGGRINFGNGPTLDSSSSFGGGSGGNMTLVALTSTGDTSDGQVNLGGATAVTTGGNSMGSNGDLLIVASRTDTGTAISLPSGNSIDTTGGAAGTGNVTLRSAVPDFTTQVVIDKPTGAVTAGSFAGGNLTAGFIEKQDGTFLFMDGATLKGSSLNRVDLRGANVLGAATVDIQAGTLAQLGTISAQTISANSAGDLNLLGNLTSPGAILLVAGGNVSTSTAGLTLSTVSSTGNAGNMTIVAGALFTQTNSTVTVTGRVLSGGGRVSFGNNPDLTSKSSFSSGSGGTITMVALTSASDQSDGQVNLGGTSDITTGGTGTGSNGDLIIVGSRNDTGTGISLPSGSTIDTTGGATGTGDVTLSSSVPDFSTPVVISKATGGVTAGSFLGGTLTDGFVEKQDGTTLTMDGSTLTGVSHNRVDVRGTNNLGTSGVVDIEAGSFSQIGVINAGTISVTSGGDLNLSGSLSAPGGMVLVAGGNVGTTTGGLSISTASSTGDAGDMTIVAGALFTQTNTAVTITGPVASGGGRINFANSPDLTSSSSSNGGSGGTITLVALTSTGDTSDGQVNLGGATDITTGGTGTGSNGDLVVVASRTDTGTAISMPSGSTINTTGGAAGTGDVTLSSSVPTFSPSIIVDKTNGGVTTGGFLGGNLTNGFIEKQDGTTLTMNGGTLTAVSLNRVDIRGTNNLGLGTGVVDIEAGTLAVLGSFTTGSLTATSGGDISLLGSITAPNGLTLVAGHNISGANGLNISTGSATGDAGNMTIVAGATFTQDATNVTITGEAASGGNISIGNGSNINAQSAFPGGDGGDINLIAYSSNTTPSAGQINIDPSVPIRSGGNGTGDNGDITIVAGRNDGGSGFSFSGTIDATGGASGTGSITIQAARFNGAVDVDKSDSSIVSGTFTGGTLANGPIQVGTLLLPPGGDLDIETASTLSIPSGTYSVDGSGVDADGGTITLVAANYNISGGGNLSLSADATGNGTGGTVSVTTLNSDITIGTGAGQIIASADGTDGTIIFHASGNLTVSPTGSMTADFITLQSDNLAPGGGVFIQAPVTANNTLTIIGRNLTNNSDLTAGVLLDAHSPAGSPLDMFGTGTFTAGVLNNITASQGDLTFHAGTYDFFGTTNFNALTGDLVVDLGATVTAHNLLNINANNINVATPGSLTGNPIHFTAPNGAGTIANSSGDVVLPDKLIFSGLSLAVLAAGNIVANKLTTIDLSSKTADGGSLTLIAGFDFTPTTLGQIGPVNTLFTMGAPTRTGGSIILPKVTVNTSSSAVGKFAGGVTMIAHGGTVNAGTIYIKTIKAEEKTAGGFGGNVVLIGQGGVQVGAGISTKAANGGSVIVLGATPVAVGGAVNVLNGQVVGPGLYSGQTPTIDNGAGILITGGITTLGTAGSGGSVLIDSDSQVEVIGGITTTGLTSATSAASQSGGNVSLRSRTSKVSVTGVINTSALKAKTALAAGDAGGISIKAMSYIATGALKALGADNTGTGAAGSGGTVSLIMEHINANAISQAFGNIIVKGIIDVHGGKGNTGSTSTPASNGGDGGHVSIDAGSVAVTGSGISINAKPGLKGKNGTTDGTTGDVFIKTYALQQLPANLDLTSKVASIPTLPGGMFTVGLGGPVNGTAGSIAADITITSKDNDGFRNGQFIADYNPTANISIDLTNATNTPTVGATGAIVTPEGLRIKVTPAQAVNLFVTSRDNLASSPIALTADNTFASQTGPITFSQNDVNGTTFTAFAMPTGSNFAITGIRPVLNLPSKIVLNGMLNFATAGATDFINLNSAAMSIGSTGNIVAAGSTLILSGTGRTWTNNGGILADQLVIARPASSPLNFISTPDGEVSLAEVMIATGMAGALALTFTAHGHNTANVPGSANAPANIGTIPFPALYKANATAIAKSARIGRGVTIGLALSRNNGGTLVPLPAVIGGTFNDSSLTVKGAASTFRIGTVSSTVQTPVIIDDGSSFTASKTITMTNAKGALTVGDGVSLIATQKLTLTADSVGIGDGNTLTAGLLSDTAPAFGAGLLTTSSILKNGTMTITGNGSAGVNGVTIGNGNMITNNGTKFNITVKIGDMLFGDSNQFTARGGNVVMLAKGNLSGGFFNLFTSQGVVKTSTGGIELGAGTTSGSIAGAFGKPSGTRIGTANIVGLNDVSPANGAIVLNPSSATTVNLNQSNTSNSAINLVLGGAVQFDAVKGGQVQLQGSNVFQTEATKPISCTNDAQSEFVIDTNEDDLVTELIVEQAAR